MGTRSRIAIENEDGTFESIYCHWDGYPSHNGKLLLENYKTESIVRKMIKLGDMSTMAPTLGVKHDFDTRDDFGCTFYRRDRGEKNVSSKKSANEEELRALTQDCGGEWLYLFRRGHWLAAEGGVAFFGNPAGEAPGAFETIETRLAKEAEAEGDIPL